MRAIVKSRYLFLPRLSTLMFSSAQKAAERHNGRIRHDLMKMDEKLDNSLSFSGWAE